MAYYLDAKAFVLSDHCLCDSLAASFLVFFDMIMMSSNTTTPMHTTTIIPDRVALPVKDSFYHFCMKWEEELDI
jgi:hypothetical protein